MSRFLHEPIRAPAMDDHVVILQHGIFGTIEDLRKIGEDLRKIGRLRIILSDVNVKRTLDGVALGGQRLADLIKQSVPRSGCSLSLICHSLGGMYGRSALAILEKENWFSANGVIAANFITLASPHLGIPEVERPWRVGIKLFGRAIGATVCDLGLRTDVVPGLCDEAGVSALQRFRRLVVYGNADDDLWIRPCSGLILPSIPDVVLNDYKPVRITADNISSSLDSAELASFPREYRDVVRKMLIRLCKLPWERYIVKFPYKIWTGAAHIKISCHPNDTQRCGVQRCGENVAAHLCQIFSMSQSKGDIDGLVPILKIQGRSPLDEPTLDETNKEEAIAATMQERNPSNKATLDETNVQKATVGSESGIFNIRPAVGVQTGRLGLLHLAGLCILFCLLGRPQTRWLGILNL